MVGTKKRDEELKTALRESYARVLDDSPYCCSAGCCTTMAANPVKIARKIGYQERELEEVPAGSNLGLGCGNPVAFASLKKGDVVLDLGSGAGLDSFIASRIVGPKGLVIGVDMTAQMIKRAKENTREHLCRGGPDNLDFRVGEIESLPVASGSVDLVISNCVINLVPDKGQAFREAFRVLKPGGRLIVSDIVLNSRLPDFVLQSIVSNVGCVAGASSRGRYLEDIRNAGFDEVTVIGGCPFPLDCMLNDPTGRAISISLEGLAEESRKLEGSISSITVRALKPGGK